MTVREVLTAIDPGITRFAWLPTRVYLFGGTFSDGIVWLRHVRRLRMIGFPRYYHARIADGGSASG